MKMINVLVQEKNGIKSEENESIKKYFLICTFLDRPDVQLFIEDTQSRIRFENGWGGCEHCIISSYKPDNEESELYLETLERREILSETKYPSLEEVEEMRATQNQIEEMSSGKTRLFWRIKRFIGKFVGAEGMFDVLVNAITHNEVSIEDYSGPVPKIKVGKFERNRKWYWMYKNKTLGVKGYGTIANIDSDNYSDGEKPYKEKVIQGIRSYRENIDQTWVKH